MNVKPRGKRLIITGGGSGIGYACAERFTKEGCETIILGRTTTKLQKAASQLGSKVKYLTWDVTNINGIGELIRQCETIFNGQIDGIVNCAGIKTTSVCKPGILETLEGYYKIFEINLNAVVFLSRRFAEYFRDHEIKGNICNVASAQGNAAKITTAYQMSKNNVIRFTRGLGKDFAKYGIIINGVCPGCTYSEMTPRGGRVNKLHYNQRTLEASEIANVICFLMSEQGTCIVGDSISADGGFVTAI